MTAVSHGHAEQREQAQPLETLKGVCSEFQGDQRADGFA